MSLSKVRSGSRALCSEQLPLTTRASPSLLLPTQSELAWDFLSPQRNRVPLPHLLKIRSHSRRETEGHGDLHERSTHLLKQQANLLHNANPG